MGDNGRSGGGFGRRMLRGALFAAGLVAFAFALQFSTPSLGSVDGYFHVRYSALVREAGWRAFPIDFPWLPYTILNPRDYYDHHMLFHVWLAPFTALGDVEGGKLAAATGAAAAFLTVYALLLDWKVRRAEWWAVATIGAVPGFLFRMEMPRVQAWSVVFLLAAVWLLERRRTGALAILAILYTWLYNAFPFLLALVAAGMAVDLAHRRKPDARPLLACAAGVAAGLVINPYFPNDIRFLAHHYLGKVTIEEAVRVGAEWYPLPLHPWLGWAFPVALITASLALLFRHRHRLDDGVHALWLMALLFFGLTWRSERFVEYLAPFGGLAAARSFHAVTDRWLGGGRRRRLAAWLVVAWVLVSAAATVWLLRGRPPAERYAEAARWIRHHVPAGAIVFNSGWDDFPLLFFHDPTHRYVIGLDPTYLSRHDPARYRHWRRVSAGEDPIPARTIREVFAAPVAVTDHAHVGFIRAMDRDPRAERVHEDRWGIVYRIAEVEPLAGKAVAVPEERGPGP